MHRCDSSSCRDTTRWSGVIRSTFTYNGCKKILHIRNTRVKLYEPSMYKHGLGTLEIETSNVNHIVDMINIEMFTIENYSIPRDNRTWFNWYGSRDHWDDSRDVYLSGSFLVIWLIELKFIVNLVLVVFCKSCCRSIACIVAFICLFWYVPREYCVERC